MTSRSDSAAPSLCLSPQSAIGNRQTRPPSVFSLLMLPEGPLRQFARKGDAFHDVVMMTPLRQEWPPAQKLDQPAINITPQKVFS